MKNTTMNGTSTAGIQAPSVNFDPSTMSVTMPVATAPVPLMARLTRHRGSRNRQWCTTMPLCDSVNPVNTPTA